MGFMIFETVKKWNKDIHEQNGAAEPVARTLIYGM